MGPEGNGAPVRLASLQCEPPSSIPLTFADDLLHLPASEHVRSSLDNGTLFRAGSEGNFLLRLAARASCGPFISEFKGRILARLPALVALKATDKEKDLKAKVEGSMDGDVLQVTSLEIQ